MRVGGFFADVVKGHDDIFVLKDAFVRRAAEKGVFSHIGGLALEGDGLRHKMGILGEVGLQFEV